MNSEQWHMLQEKVDRVNSRLYRMLYLSLYSRLVEFNWDWKDSFQSEKKLLKSKRECCYWSYRDFRRRRPAGARRPARRQIWICWRPTRAPKARRAPTGSCAGSVSTGHSIRTMRSICSIRTVRCIRTTGRNRCPSTVPVRASTPHRSVLF